MTFWVVCEGLPLGTQGVVPSLVIPVLVSGAVAPPWRLSSALAFLNAPLRCSTCCSASSAWCVTPCTFLHPESSHCNCCHPMHTHDLANLALQKLQC